MSAYDGIHTIADGIRTQVQLQAETDTAYPTQIERIEHKCRAYGLTVPPHLASMTKVQAADILHLLPGWHGGHPANLRSDYDNLIALQTGIPVAPSKREDRLTDDISVNFNGRLTKIRSVLRVGDTHDTI